MLKDAPLGQSTEYVQTYSPNLLYPVPRTLSRDKIKISQSNLPFEGVDVWNGYELSWLNSKGKPEIAISEFRFPCTSKNIVESKSFKLYLNSFNQSSFDSAKQVKDIIEQDLSEIIEGPVEIAFKNPSQFKKISLFEFDGLCLDYLDIQTDKYQVEPMFLRTGHSEVEETLYSNLLKSNCLATGQPDWGSVLIRYLGTNIDHEGLLKYIISYRNHFGFAEHCVEQIFVHIMNQCHPKRLTVYARYTRRGGLDINPFRSNFETLNNNTGVIRQ